MTRGQAVPCSTLQRRACKTTVRRARDGVACRPRPRSCRPPTTRGHARRSALQGPLNQREIGAELYLSVNTIKGYTKSLYNKLGAASRAEAVERGRELGLI